VVSVLSLKSIVVSREKARRKFVPSELVFPRGSCYLINQTPLVHALCARAGILLLITNEFPTEGLRAYGSSKFQNPVAIFPHCHTLSLRTVICVHLLSVRTSQLNQPNRIVVLRNMRLVLVFRARSNLYHAKEYTSLGMPRNQNLLQSV